MPLQGPTTPGRRKEGPSAAASWRWARPVLRGGSQGEEAAEQVAAPTDHGPAFSLGLTAELPTTKHQLGQPVLVPSRASSPVAQRLFLLSALLERETSRFFAWEPPESTNGGAAEGGKMPLGLPLGALVLLLFHP
ncbi:hypothetical protein E2320_007270, partial [Naja naja]